MGLLKTTAISRLVPTPLVWGTTINIAGAPEASGAGGLEAPLQPMRKTAARRAAEPLENCRSDIRFLQQTSASSSGGTHQVSRATLAKAQRGPRQVRNRRSRAHLRHEPLA